MPAIYRHFIQSYALGMVTAPHAHLDRAEKSEQNHSTGWTCSMTTQSCPDCYTAGDGNCQMCHGEGKIHSERRFGESPAEMPCPRCEGSGACPTCAGAGVIEAGGEG